MIQRLGAAFIKAFRPAYGTRLRGLIDRAADVLSIKDFSQYDTDVGAAVNSAIAQIRTEDSATMADQAGGKVHLPRGYMQAASPMTVDMIPGVGGLGVSIQGEGVAASFVDYKGASVDGIVGNADAGPLYGKFNGFTVANARSAMRLIKGSRSEISHVEAYVPSSDGFNFQNLIMTRVQNCFVTAGKSHGFNYTSSFGAGASQEKTSILHSNNWVRRTAGHGHILGNMSYSVSMANGADECGGAGYYVSGRSYGAGSLFDGAESQQNSGWLVEALNATDEIVNFHIKGGYGRSNNRAGGNASMIGIRAANGGKATVIIDGVVNNPQAGASGGECVIVNGDGAVARLHGNAVLPNKFRSRNGGYIDYTPITQTNKVTFKAGTAAGVFNLTNAQGTTLRLGGDVLIVARNTHASEESGNVGYYRLFLDKTGYDGARVVVEREAGYAKAASPTATNWPSFTWTLSDSGQLIATPRGATVGTFYFEIETCRFLAASAS